MSLKPLPPPPDLPIEHFRCVSRAETLLRTACASNYARVAVSGKAPGNDKHCSGCTIGAVHATGRVPTHKAPAVNAPKDVEPVTETRPRSARPAAPPAPAPPAPTSPVGIRWEEQPLGKERDLHIANRLGVQSSSVRRAREARGIAPFVDAAGPERTGTCESCPETFVCAPRGRVPTQCPKCKAGQPWPKPQAEPARIGRPPLDPEQAHDSLLSVRTTKTDRARIDAAAVRAGLTTSEWARVALLGAATIVGVR